jgi:transcriptional regulator with XRE-family HTH domain
MLFGNKIRELRDKNGVLQRQLATHLEMDTPMFSKIERGARSTKRSHVILLAEYFHIEAKEMLTLWLADKMLYAIKGENETELSLKAFDLAKRTTTEASISIINS